MVHLPGSCSAAGELGDVCRMATPRSGFRDSKRNILCLLLCSTLASDGSTTWDLLAQWNSFLIGLPMWKCGNCGEEIEDSFDVCWNCGTTRDGHVDPDFTPEENRTGGDSGDLLLLLRKWLAAAWRFVTAPPRQDVPRWLSRCCTLILLVAGSLFAAVVADFALRVEPAVDQAIRDFERHYPDSNSPGIPFLLPGIAHAAFATAIVLFMTAFTMVSWRYHGVWTKLLGFSPLLVAWIGRIVLGT